MSEPEWTYVSREFEVVTGEAARAFVEKTNDRRFLTRDAGIHTVSVERWKLAQDAERHHWLDLRPHVNEANNMDHAYMFDRYEMLRGQVFESAIELGCGPFTNIAVMAQLCQVKRLTLLDPLIEDYLKHPNCSFRDGSVPLPSGERLPVAERVALPIEQFDPKIRYDLVVMLNVIEHCYNVPVIFRKIWDMLTPGGTLIFHDRYYDHAQVALEAEKVYDAAHPLKVDRRLIDEFIKRFERVFRRFVTTRGKTSFSGTGDEIYFVGRKPEAA
jgi:SAM-dependent methyltransferase